VVGGPDAGVQDMSAKNKLENKRERRMIRALRKGCIPVYVDLVQWLRDRGEAQTAGAARKLIGERRVKSESHVLGFRFVERDLLNEESGKREPTQVEIYDARVPSQFMGAARVMAPEPVAS
jgi:hypothetical protein